MQKDDIVLASSLSVFGSAMSQIKEVIDICAQNEISVITIKDQFHIDYKDNLNYLLQAIDLVLKMKFSLASDSSRKVLTELKEKGQNIGRPDGRKNVNLKLDPYTEEIRKLLAQKMSMDKIAKIYQVNRKTVLNFAQRKNLPYLGRKKDLLNEH